MEVLEVQAEVRQTEPNLVESTEHLGDLVVAEASLLLEGSAVGLSELVMNDRCMSEECSTKEMRLSLV